MHIPYLPSPLHDEVLGSWFSRVRLYNGESVWTNLLKEAGYARHQASLFRIPDFDPKLERLLQLLHMTFGTALRKHTHLPYVMPFQDVVHRGLESFDSSTKRGKSVQERALLKGWQTAPRYCPECLSQDFEEGEPRWRLSHQLPNVHFCSTHDTQLRFACEVCNRVIGNAGDALVPSLRVSCECGERLDRRRTPSPVEPAAHRSVRKLSMEAFQHGKGDWSGEQLRAHLEALLGKHSTTTSPSQNYAKFLDMGIPGYRSERAGTRAFFHHDATATSMELNTDWTLARAPELCAVMALLGRDFCEDAKTLAHVRVPTRKRRLETTDATMRAELAKLFAGRARGESTVPSTSKAYWHFRMKDPAYLQLQCPGLPLSRVPTILEDRATMKRRMGDLHSHPAKILGRVGTDRVLRYRILLRDEEWLQETLAELKVKRAEMGRANRIKELTLSQLEPVRQAIQTLTSPGARPVRLAVNEIGREAKMPIHAVQRVLAASEDLSGHIARWNANFIGTVLDWAAEALHQSGGVLRVSPLCKTAAIALSPSNMDAAEQAIKRYALVHALLPAQYQLRVRRSLEPQPALTQQEPP